jgi:hypothetical protein
VVNKVVTLVVEEVTVAAVSVLQSIPSLQHLESKADQQIKDTPVVEADMVAVSNNKVVVDGTRENWYRSLLHQARVRQYDMILEDKKKVSYGYSES